jgi:hypothetical protein
MFWPKSSQPGLIDDLRPVYNAGEEAADTAAAVSIPPLKPKWLTMLIQDDAGCFQPRRLEGIED